MKIKFFNWFLEFTKKGKQLRAYENETRKSSEIATKFYGFLFL